MSPANLILGCSVFLAAFGGLIASCIIVDAIIPPKISSGTSAGPRQAPAKVEANSRSDIAVRGESSHHAELEGLRLHGRFCVGLRGNTFGWDWPNVPFGALACGDAGPN
jgi:hypothetical protein